MWSLYKEYPELPPEDQACVRAAGRDALQRMLLPAAVSMAVAYSPFRFVKRLHNNPAAASVKWGLTFGCGALAAGIGYHFVSRDFTRSVLKLSPKTSALRKGAFPVVLEYNPSLSDELHEARVRRYREIQASHGADAADAWIRTGNVPGEKPKS